MPQNPRASSGKTSASSGSGGVGNHASIAPTKAAASGWRARHHAAEPNPAAAPPGQEVLDGLPASRATLFERRGVPPARLIVLPLLEQFVRHGGVDRGANPRPIGRRLTMLLQCRVEFR